MPLAFDGQLGDEQTPVVHKALAALRDTSTGRGALIALPTGSGKTVIALAIATGLRVKTMIVVHKEFLATQWRDRISSFVPGARIGRIQGATCTTDGADFVIAMVQTLANGRVPIAKFAGIGLTIFDEVHHMSAEHFSNALTCGATSRHRLGLSATMDRKDGTSIALRWLIGPVVHASQAPPGMVTVHTRTWGVQVGTDDDVSSMATMISTIASDDQRTRALCRATASLITNDNRVCVILSDRRHHCERIVTTLGSMGIKAGLYLGGMAAHDLDQTSCACSAIVGTYAMIAEGFDVPRVDAVVFATPRGDVRQATGRATRRGGAGLARGAIVLDICDAIMGCGLVAGLAKKRGRWYAEMGFDIDTDSL